jgi:hypothetical protein
VTATAELEQAVRHVRADLDAHTWADLGPHFTCREADALAHLLDTIGLGDQAAALRDGHAGADEPGDAHYTKES